MNEMSVEFIAPCGMNCRICEAYQREKNQCKGCRSDRGYKAKSCSRCLIRNCTVIKSNKTSFCFECDQFPCQKLKQLDKRYRTKYYMSMIENLECIKQYGINEFLQNEKIKWACKECGGIICVHKHTCSVCKKTYSLI